ncbi:hypothetical protein Vafri_10888 [Volvox africanus]|nr:hypothetical protein Vafri_10888 [Volvox africanus]
MSAIVRCLAVAGSSAAHTGSGSGMLAAVPRSGRTAAIVALAAALVACCCRRTEERNLAIAAGAPEKMLRLLLGSDRADTQVAALEGLSLMLPYQPSACALALSCPEIYGRLFTLLRDPTPSVRLLAASCAATLCRMPGCEQTEAMQRAALPVLLRLLTQPATRPHVPAVLASLVEASEALQKAAADADAVRLLAGLLAAEAVAAEAETTTARTTGQAVAAPDAAAVSSGVTPYLATCAAADGGVSSSLREGCLRALGSLCLNHDESRKQLLEAKVLRHIVKALEDPSNGVRAAAALCVRALTRCVRTLRGGLLEGGGGELAQLLVDMLTDQELEVQTNAAAAVCNLVLDFSAVKSAVLSAGGLTRLVELTRSPATPLRHHATWALANMLYRADNSVRVQLMEALPWSRLRQLLFDSDPRVVEQALVILRNLCMAGRQQVAAALEWAESDRSGGGGECGGSGGGFASVTGLCTTPAPAHGHGPPDQQPLPATGDKETRYDGILDVLQARIQAAAAAMSVTDVESESAASTPGVSHSPHSEGAASPPSASASAPALAAAAATTAGIFRVTRPEQYLQTVAHATHALYAVANLLTGGATVKDLVASRRPLLAAVAALLYPRAGELALPAVWCAVNLTWPAGGGSGGGGGGGVDRLNRLEQEAVATRCNALLDVRGEERLEELSRQHPSRDVQERARTALEQLRSGAGLAVRTSDTSSPAAVMTALTAQGL